MRKGIKKAIAGIAIASSMVSLSGCASTMITSDVASYPLVPALTIGEVVEYYAKAMSFDAIVTKDVDVDKTTYETRDVIDEERQSNILGYIEAAEELLSSMDYEVNATNIRALDPEVYHYIKAYLNDRKVEEKTVDSIKEALGYYFVDVTYTLSGRTEGKYKPLANLLGLNGAFKFNVREQKDEVDNLFMKACMKRLQEYYDENNIEDKVAYFNEVTGFFTTDPKEAEEDEKASKLDFTDSTADSEEEEDEDESVDFLADRTPRIDVSEFNTIAGSSKGMSAYMPAIDMIYETPKPEGIFSGIGMYTIGTSGLSKFGYNREEMDGTVTLRYVYKDDLENPSQLHNVNVYPVFSEVVTGWSSNNDSIVPEFVRTEIEKLIERADRAIVNCDLSALMSGKIFSDMGVAVLRGYENNHVNLLRQISTVRRILSRDIAANAYLVEIETQRQEGAKGADVYGTFRDKSYVTVEQKGQEFVITDWMVMTRQMQTEPDINPDSAVAKRVVALGMAGEVSESAKDGATKLINDLYAASTHRLLTGPSTITKDGKEIYLERGMYDCFNKNVEMLSSSKYEDLNSKLRSLLVKHGVHVDAEYSGIVTQWIGGADNQVEFTTEEIITYEGRNDGVYMECYYLVSNMDDKWVIDDIQVLSSEEHSGEALEKDIRRIRPETHATGFGDQLNNQEEIDTETDDNETDTEDEDGVEGEE